MKIFSSTSDLINRHSTSILLTIIVIFAGGSMLMTVINSTLTRQVAINTKNTVDGQNKILAAIKKATSDNNITATQKNNIVICMLQVPQAERIPKESDCRKQALTNSDTSNKTFQGTSSAGSKASGVSSSPNSVPSKGTSQSDNSQQNTPPVKSPLTILGIPACTPSSTPSNGICVER